MKLLKRLFFLGLLFHSLFLTGCASTQKQNSASINIDECLPVSQLCPSQIEWEEIEPGISYFSYNVNLIKVKWHAVRIDLQTPGMEIITNPENNASVLFNTTPFYNNNDLMGIAVNNGKCFSPEQKRLTSLYLKKVSNSKIIAKIISQASIDKDSLYEEGTWIIGGYFNLIVDGDIQEFNNIPHSNTVCGISKDERYLYVMVAIPTISLSDENGLYYKECALILQELGCYNAISFDGGKSTQMYVKGKGTFAPSLKRKVPACLGFSNSNLK